MEIPENPQKILRISLHAFCSMRMKIFQFRAPGGNNASYSARFRSKACGSILLFSAAQRILHRPNAAVAPCS
jgi:hypothetical protein